MLTLLIGPVFKVQYAKWCAVCSQLLHRWTRAESRRLPEDAFVGHTERADRKGAEGEAALLCMQTGTMTEKKVSEEGALDSTASQTSCIQCEHKLPLKKMDGFYFYYCWPQAPEVFGSLV